MRQQLLKFAEKKIVFLRGCYRDNPALVSNEEIIQDFLVQGMDLVETTTELSSLKDCGLVFEAIYEDLEIKTRVLEQINALAHPQALFLTNTSSIPISILSDRSGIEKHRLIGFHFFNPPAVQKLIEVIALEENAQKLAQELAQRLEKTTVLSGDIAGFIGNGHFIREVHFACRLVGELSNKLPQEEAVHFVNQITQAFLLRPMGIFQLVDYVGVDICSHIMEIMKNLFS